MSAVPDSFRRAEAHYAAGRFEDAAALLAEIVRGEPRHVEALVLLGLSAGRAGRLSEALGWLEQARDADPNAAAAWRGLGLVSRQLGRVPESLAAYARALALQPDDAPTHVNLAVALKAAGELRRAVAHLETAIRLAPQLPAAYFNLGNCLFDLQDLDRAGAAYVECLKRDPRDTAAALGVAKVFREQGRHDMAEKTLQAAVRLVPDEPEVSAALAALWHDLGRTAEARALLDRVLAARPDHARALYFRANLERDSGHLAEAEALYRRALEADGGDVEAGFGLATTLVQRGRPAEAIDVIGRLRDAHRDDAEIRHRCALALLDAGELAAGWPEYRWRLKTVKHRAVRFCHLPAFDDLRFAGRKVVIWGDQGLGDEIIYASMLADLKKHAASIVCEVDRRLVPLLRRGLPEFTFVERSFSPALPPAVSDDEALTAWRNARLAADFQGATHQIAVPDLGRFLRPSFESFPAPAPYLRADPARVAAFRQWLAPRSGERVIGLSWVSRNKPLQRYKSLDLQTLVAALPRDGLRLVNLQYGDVAPEIAAVARDRGRRVEIAPDLDYFNDIEGLAALIAACDAVITVSTVTVHLAGALGAPTALLCPELHGKPWYWFRGRHDCPWYTDVRLFRQARDGSWGPALEAVAGWLRKGRVTR